MTEDEFKKRATDKYAAARSDFKGSSTWTRYKALKPVVRFYAGALIIFAVVIALVAVL